MIDFLRQAVPFGTSRSKNQSDCLEFGSQNRGRLSDVLYLRAAGTTIYNKDYMSQNQSASPYRPLGKKLKLMRDQARETLAEASGAVEIEVRQLAAYELGQSRPGEEVLLLLISHFGAKDDEAIQLWELAGYGMSRIPVAHIASGDEILQSSNVTAENRIMFTDTVDVIVNNYGVVMNFMQNSGAKAAPAIVSRVGMSREHAKSVLQILQMTLAQTENNGLKFPEKSISPDISISEEKTGNA